MPCLLFTTDTLGSCPMTGCSYNYLTTPTCTHTHCLTLSFSPFCTQTQSNTQAPNAFYFCDHNYLMTGLLVSQPPFCTLDLSVNNLALRARKVGPLKQQVQANSGGRTHTEREHCHPIFVIRPLLTYSSLVRLLCFHRAVCWSKFEFIHPYKQPFSTAGSTVSSSKKVRSSLDGVTPFLHPLFNQPSWRNSRENWISAMKTPSQERWVLMTPLYFDIIGFTVINVSEETLVKVISIIKPPLSLFFLNNCKTISRWF